MDPYEKLLALARRRRDAVEAGRYDELAALDAEREGLVAALPPQPPAAAAPALDELAGLLVSTHALLAERLEATAAELGATRRARQVARGYGGGAARRSSVSAEA